MLTTQYLTLMAAASSPTIVDHEAVGLRLPPGFRPPSQLPRLTATAESTATHLIALSVHANGLFSAPPPSRYHRLSEGDDHHLARPLRERKASTRIQKVSSMYSLTAAIFLARFSTSPQRYYCLRYT